MDSGMHCVVFGAKNSDSVFGLFSNAINASLNLSGIQSKVMNLNLGYEELLSYKEYLEKKDLKMQVVQVSNNSNFDWNVFALRKYPSVLVFHDLFLWDAFEKFIREDALLKYPNEFVFSENRLIPRAKAEEWISITGWELNWRTVNALELLARLVLLGSAVITHSLWAKNRLEELLSILSLQFEKLPVAHSVPLPKFESKFQPLKIDDSFEDEIYEKVSKFSGCIVTVLGHIDENRGALEIAKAALNFSPKEILLLFVGPINQNLSTEISRLCSLNVLSLGQVSEKLYDKLINRSDVFLNIRKSPTEAASGTLIDQISTGKPVIMNKSGCRLDFESLPNSLFVSEVSPKYIEEAIRFAVTMEPNKDLNSYRPLGLIDYADQVSSIVHQVEVELDVFEKKTFTLVSLYSF
jgi:glycosyltransferase involved in cell wall biosynthesis